MVIKNIDDDKYELLRKCVRLYEEENNWKY